MSNLFLLFRTLVFTLDSSRRKVSVDYYQLTEAISADSIG